MNVVNTPGPFNRFEPSTGILVRGVRVNGHYIIVDECSLGVEQEIDVKHYVQGGPRAAVADIGKRIIQGKIVCPARVDYAGNLESAIAELIRVAEDPRRRLTIDTNHSLTFAGLPAESGGTDDNELLSFNNVAISELVVDSTPDRGVMVTATIKGAISSRVAADLVAPPTSYLLGREISWMDCDTWRDESAMRVVSGFSVTLVNDVQMPVFIPPIHSDNRADTSPGNQPWEPDYAFMPDHPWVVGVASSTWTAQYEELLRSGAETHTHMHGGFMVGEDVTFKFGPFRAVLRAPLFKASQNPLTPGVMKRTTSIWAIANASLEQGATPFFEFD